MHFLIHTQLSSDQSVHVPGCARVSFMCLQCGQGLLVLQWCRVLCVLPQVHLPSQMSYITFSLILKYTVAFHENNSGDVGMV